MNALAYKNYIKILLLATIVLSHEEIRKLFFLNKYVMMIASGGFFGLKIGSIELLSSHFLSHARCFLQMKLVHIVR